MEREVREKRENERQGQKGEPGSNNNQKVVIKDEPVEECRV